MSEEVSWTDPKTWEVCHETKKEIDVESKFFANTTGVSYYDGLLEFPKYHREYKGDCGKIEMMSPDEYIYHCAVVRSSPSSIDEEMRNVSGVCVEKYRQRSLRGEKMPIPVIDKHRCSQEGRHRAMTAKKLGLKSIPVLVVERC